jgi:hypothetical protein
MKLIYDGYRGGQVGGPTVGQQGGEAADGDGWDDAVEGDELGVSKMRRRNRTKEMSCARRTTVGRSTLEETTWGPTSTKNLYMASRNGPANKARPVRWARQVQAERSWTLVPESAHRIFPDDKYMKRR